MDRIRAFIEADIPQVVRLHETIVEPEAAARAGQPPSNGYFTQVFLDNPSRDEALPSLVYEDDDGQIVGFLGVVPRRMSMNGEPLKAAVWLNVPNEPPSIIPVARGGPSPFLVMTEMTPPSASAP